MIFHQLRNVNLSESIILQPFIHNNTFVVHAYGIHLNGYYITDRECDISKK